MKEKIAIAGAGIAGLTTAHALLQAGYEVTVFERASQLRKTGAGITIQSNAMAALAAIGRAKGVEEIGLPIQAASIVSWKGTILRSLDIEKISKQIGFQGVAVERGLLIEVLAQGLKDRIIFDATVNDVEISDDEVIIKFAEGGAKSFDGLVGCDGIHSNVRGALFGESELRYAGYTSWRGLAEMDTTGIGLDEFWGPGRRFGVVPIAKTKVYWFAVENEGAGKLREADGMLAQLVEEFDEWPKVVKAVLAHTKPGDILQTDCYDLPPQKKWGEGLVTMVGDSIHPLTPNLGQGGGQAIESAVVLGRMLESIDRVETAFRSYESLRRERTRRFVKDSWRIGKIGQFKFAPLRGLRDFGLQLMPKKRAAQMVADYYDFEAWYDGAKSG